MEVAIIVHRLMQSRGGAEGWTIRFVQWLCRQGHSVHLVSSHLPTPHFAQFCEKQTIYPAGNQFEFARFVSTEFDRRNADIVHDMGYGYKCDVFHPHAGSQRALNEARAAAYTGIRRLSFQLFRRVGVRQRKLTALAGKQFQQNSAHFLAVSQKVANDIIRMHDVPKERIHVVHNGVDIQLFSPELRQRNRSAARNYLRAADVDLLLLCIAHNHKLKGVPTLLQMLEDPKIKNIHLVVVGGHTQRPLDRTIGSSRVTFVGACDDVMQFYAAADAFVLPTHYDACSLTVLEAMACGLPVITTRSNGASELIENQVDGLLLESSTDLPALRASIEACRCEKNRERLGENARNKMRQNSLEKNFAAIEVVYRQIVSQVRVAA